MYSSVSWVVLVVKGGWLEIGVVFALAIEARPRNELDSAVLKAALFGEVVSDRVRFAEADCLQAAEVDALTGQVGLNRVRAAL